MKRNMANITNEIEEKSENKCKDKKKNNKKEDYSYERR